MGKVGFCGANLHRLKDGTGRREAKRTGKAGSKKTSLPQNYCQPSPETAPGPAFGNLFPGQMAFPGPGGLEGFLNAAGGLPAHHLIGLGGIGPDGGNVTGAAGGDAVRHLNAVHFLKGVNQFHHAQGTAGTHVEDFHDPELAYGDLFESV